jgi:hypothetical protein
MNPPYAQPLIARFSEKLVAELDAGSITQAIVLVNNATETAWFQSMHKRATAVCFNKARIKFLDPEGNPGAPLQGQAFLYFGASIQGFLDEFAQHGECVVKAPPAPSPRLPQVTLEAEIVEPVAPATAPAQIELETTVEIEVGEPPAAPVRLKATSPASPSQSAAILVLEIYKLLPKMSEGDLKGASASLTELVGVIESRWMKGGRP